MKQISNWENAYVDIGKYSVSSFHNRMVKMNEWINEWKKLHDGYHIEAGMTGGGDGCRINK